MEKTYQDFTADLPQIKALLATDGIEDCIEKIKQYIPGTSAKYDLIILLMTSYKEIRSDQVKGILTNAEENRLLNKLTDRVLNFLNQIEEIDFAKASDNEKNNDSRVGKVKYNIPAKMQLNEETECCVWIALDEATILKEVGETVGEIKDIRVSNVMGVELFCHKKGDAFKIESYDDAEQLIEKDFATTWAFYVTPLLEGKYPLILRISVIISVDGEKINKTKVLREIIQITAEKPEVLVGETTEKEAAGIFLTTAGTGLTNDSLNRMDEMAIPEPEPLSPMTPPPPPSPLPKPKTIQPPAPPKKTPARNRQRFMGAVAGILGIVLVSLWTFNNFEERRDSIDVASKTKLTWEEVETSKDTTLIKRFIEDNIGGKAEEKAKDLLAELRKDSPSVNQKRIAEKPDAITPKDKAVSPSKQETNKTKPTSANPTIETKVVSFKSVARKPIFFSCRKKKKRKQDDCTAFAIRQFVQKRLGTKSENLNGQVKIKFLIDEIGAVSNVDVISKTNEKLAKETVKIIHEMPDFLPGQNANGDAVGVLYELPVTFRAN